MIMKKSLTQRSADAVKNGGKSGDLRAIHVEVTERLAAVETEQKNLDRGISAMEREGDLDGLRETRQKQADLKDEERVLLLQRTELHQAIKFAVGEEAVAGAEKLNKNLQQALQKAQQAQAVLAECRSVVLGAIQARSHAQEIGKEIVFDPDLIRGLAQAAYSDRNECNQAQIDLGIAVAIERTRFNPGTARAR